jgi:hypothetical protein
MRLLPLFVLFAAWAPFVRAQSLLSDPPPILQIVRKPGTAGASIRPYANAQAQVNVLGMRSITGLPEIWQVEAHYSFASLEDLDRRLAALAPVRATNDPVGPLQDDVLAPARTMIALYRPNWSFRPTEALRALPKARYFQVSVFRIRPGTESDFGQLINLRRATADAINLDRPDFAFQVISGAPAGTFLFLSPIATLRTLDEGVNPVPVYAEPIAAARQKDGKQISADIEISREHLLFRIEPQVSYVSDDFAGADPKFWRK